MAHAPVLIVDADENRRRTLSLLIRTAARLDVQDFPALGAAFPGFCAPGSRVLPEKTRLFLCPWDEGGEAMVLERIVLGGKGPTLLMLSDKITPARIALCHNAGKTHLISTDPLNLNALRTRILLSLEGPSTLATRISRSDGAMSETLAAFPGLRRRLAI